jgi:hypothetical protein
VTLRALICACGKPTSEAAYICGDCKEELWRAIGDAPTLSGELEVTLTRQARMTDGGVRAATEAPLPYDTAASELLHAIRAELVALARLCVDHDVASRGGPLDWPADTVEAMSSWLLWRIDGIAGQPWAADAMRLAQLTSRAEYVIDRPPEKTFAGPCGDCGRDLYAQHGAVIVTCTCGEQYDLAERRAWLLRVVDDRLATAVEIARALTSLDVPVTAERIRQWSHRDRLVSSGHDRLGRPLYRVGDVVDLLVETRKRA